MKKMKIMLGLISLAAMFFVLCSCSSESLLIGKWESDGDSFFCDTIEFFSDGTYDTEVASWEGTYSVDGNRLKFHGRLNSGVVSFKVKGNELILTGDSWSSARYTRVGKSSAGFFAPNIFKIIFTNWWTFEFTVQMLIAIIVFIVSMSGKSKFSQIKQVKESLPNCLPIAQFTKNFFYLEVFSLLCCIIINGYLFVKASSGEAMYTSPVEYIIFCICLGLSVGFIGGIYYCGELNKSIQYGYLLVEGEKLIARNPEIGGFSVKLTAIKEVGVLKYKPKKLPPVYRFLPFYKIEIYANNTHYEVLGVENAYMIKNLIEQKISEASRKM